MHSEVAGIDDNNVSGDSDTERPDLCLISLSVVAGGSRREDDNHCHGQVEISSVQQWGRGVHQYPQAKLLEVPSHDQSPLLISLGLVLPGLYTSNFCRQRNVEQDWSNLVPSSIDLDPVQHTGSFA